MTQIIARAEADLIAALRHATGTVVQIRGTGTADPDTATIRVATRGISVNDDGCDLDDLAFCGSVLVTLAAGEPWDDFVAHAVTEGWVGVEALAGLGGSVGGVTVRNPSRFGRCPADTLASVRTIDRVTGSQRTFAFADCGFRPDGSRFRDERLPDGSVRYVVVEASYQLRQGDLTTPITDPEHAAALGIPPGGRVSLTVARDLALAGQG